MIVLLLQKPNSLWEHQIEAFQREFPNVTLTTDTERLKDAEVIIATRITEEQCKKASKLQAVIAPMAGIDTLPLRCLQDRGIRLANVHGNVHSVAERTVALILAWYGKIIAYHNDLKNNTWHGFWVGKSTEDSWESLMGKQCTILGAGRIGKETALRLKPFGVLLGGYKRSMESTHQTIYDILFTDIDEALQWGEIIVSLLPSTDETQGLIGKERISRMEGKVLINTGRGSVIDEQALYEGLSAGILRGAALDCWYTYPSPDNRSPNPSRFPFEQLSNVVLSPHIAGFTQDSVARCIAEAFENLRRYINRKDFLYEADIRLGY